MTGVIREWAFLWVAKAGGTSTVDVLRHAMGQRLRVHARHGKSITEVDEPKVFCLVRDPVARFQSAFYSRYRKGRPAGFRDWNALEEHVFEQYPTSADLADGLIKGDRFAFDAMPHLYPLSSYFDDALTLRWMIESGKLAFCADVSRLNAAWLPLCQVLGVQAPFPQRLHAAPQRPEQLSPLQRQAIEDYYACDYPLLRILAEHFDHCVAHEPRSYRSDGPSGPGGTSPARGLGPTSTSSPTPSPTHPSQPDVG